MTMLHFYVAYSDPPFSVYEEIRVQCFSQTYYPQQLSLHDPMWWRRWGQIEQGSFQMEQAS